jgi:hypothetical protein
METPEEGVLRDLSHHAPHTRHGRPPVDGAGMMANSHRMSYVASIPLPASSGVFAGDGPRRVASRLSAFGNTDSHARPAKAETSLEPVA